MAVRSSHDALLVSSTNGAGSFRSSHEALLISVTVPLMSITYPLSPPAISGIGPQDFTMEEVNVIGESVSPFTLGQQIQQWPGQMFQIEMNLPPMLYQQAEQWLSMLSSLFGKYGTFLMGDYNRPTPQGPFSGAPISSGSNPPQVNVLNLRGCTPSIANWAIAGDYIQLTAAGSPQRIYKVLQNASSDVAGNVSLMIFPNLRENVPDSTAIVTANCQGTFRLQENTFKWKVDRNKVYTISFKAKEAF